jgi:branched-chain amino acid transport system substrate-binding protein
MERNPKTPQSIPRRISFLIITILILAFGRNTVAAEPYKIGLITHLSGFAAFVGVPEKNAAELFAEAINKKGGINGQPVKLIVYDDAGDTSKGVLAAKRLIEQDDVHGIIGPSLSGIALAIIPFVEEKGVPIIVGATAVELAEPPKKWVFQIIPTIIHETEMNLRFVKNKGITKVGLLCATDAWGKEAKKWSEQLAPKIGVDIVASEWLGASDTDVTTQLTKIKASGARAIILTVASAAGVVVEKNYHQLGLDQLLILGSGMSSKKYIDAAGPVAEGHYVPGYRINLWDILPAKDPSKALILNFKSEYEKKYKQEVDIYGAQAWDQMLVMTEAMKKSGPNRVKLRDAIEQTQNLVGLIGVHNFMPTRHSSAGPESLYMLKIVNGQFQLAK